MLAPYKVHFLYDGHPDTILILAEDGIQAVDIFFEMVDYLELHKYDFVLNHPLCFVENLYFQSRDKLNKLKDYGNI